MSRVCEYENLFPYGNWVAQVARHIVFPMRFSGFEIDRHQIIGLSVSPVLGNDAIADPQTCLDFEISLAITVDNFWFRLSDIDDSVALAVAGA